MMYLNGIETITVLSHWLSCKNLA